MQEYLSVVYFHRGTEWKKNYHKVDLATMLAVHWLGLRSRWGRCKGAGKGAATLITSVYSLGCNY